MKQTSDSGMWLTVGGMLALLGGRKLAGLGMLGKGMSQIEAAWRENHPEFQGGFKDRWNEAARFYAATHSNKVNRWLHMAGIPLIASGAVGLLLFKPFRPFWFVSATSFVGGWALNIVGHSVFEKNKPAFADDPLSFVVGPVWDVQQFFKGSSDVRVKFTPSPAPNAHHAQA